MKDNKYKGVVVPMVTPVTEQREIDIPAVEKIIESFTTHHVHPLLMGTTGEGNSVSPEQGLIVVKTAVASRMNLFNKDNSSPYLLQRGTSESIDPSSPPASYPPLEGGRGRILLQPPMVIYAGLNGCCVSEHIRMANLYHKLGADVIVATLPSYYALTNEQMYDYYKTLADNITAPLMLYNIKATTHMSIPVEVVKRLSTHPNIVGLKDSERDMTRMDECLAISRNNPGFSFFCGWAAQSANSLLNGADGIVPSTGNFTPGMFAELYNAAVSGDIKKANDLQSETDDIARIYQEGRTLGQSLAALKVMMSTKNLCQPYMLAPLTPLTAEEAATCRQKTALI